MDQHFKILRAHEEILRLNIEIPRVITYMRDEDAYLLKKESDLREAAPLIANHIALRREDRGRFNDLHLQRFRKLSLLPGFTGSLLPGVSRDMATEVINADDGEGRMDEIESTRADDAGMVDGRNTNEGDDEDGEDEDQEDQELATLLYSVLSISTD